ncbi:MAG TPA: NAD(P)-dependent oxidoreductase [Candidatus Acidoferrales bacterium]|nr:NAD(P)-dependent oxidoreductase [Candidatus Acidoferrales bacterium]
MSEQIGFIGLGNMGIPIAENLLRAGYALTVYNRTASKAAGLVAAGAKSVSSAAEVATSGGIVVTMLADDHAIEEICAGDDSFVTRLGVGGIHISMSTVAPATARRLAEEHAKNNVTYVAAPVFGRPEAAASRQLAICVSGPADAKKRAAPILAAVGRAIFDFGEDEGAANVVKVCGNFLLAAAIEAMAEAFTLAEKNGIDRKRVAETLTQTLFPCPVYQGYGKRIAENSYEPAGFRLALGLKDINLVLQTAGSSPMPMPLASLLRDRWLGAMTKHRENLDWSAAALGVSDDAGITNVRAVPAK